LNSDFLGNRVEVPVCGYIATTFKEDIVEQKQWEQEKRIAGIERQPAKSRFQMDEELQ
jgi:hypothetical protein